MLPEVLSNYFAKVSAELVKKGITTIDKIGDERQRAKVMEMLKEVNKEDK